MKALFNEPVHKNKGIGALNVLLRSHIICATCGAHALALGDLLTEILLSCRICCRKTTVSPKGQLLFRE